MKRRGGGPPGLVPVWGTPPLAPASPIAQPSSRHPSRPRHPSRNHHARATHRAKPKPASPITPAPPWIGTCAMTPPKPPRTGYTPVHAPPWQALTRCHSQATEAPRTPPGTAYEGRFIVLATGTMLPIPAKWFAYADSGRDTRRNRETLRVAPPWQGADTRGRGDDGSNLHRGRNGFCGAYPVPNGNRTATTTP